VNHTANETKYYGGLKQVFVVSLGLFIVFLDSTIVNIALPNIIDEYNIGLSFASWIINAFVITLAVLLVTMGKIADIFGKAKLYTIGLILFMISSFLCGIAPNAESLIVFRILQGISGSMVIPTSMILVREAVPPQKIGLAMGIWGAVGALAVAIGPSLGGIITESINWRWVFYINVPVILLGLPFTYIILRKIIETKKAFQIDVFGVLTLSIALFSLTYSILNGQDFGWTSWEILFGFSFSIICFILFVIIEAKVKNPLLDFQILKNHAYVAGIVSNLLSGIILMGTMILLPIFLIEVKEFDIIKASLLITPLSAVMLIVAPLIGRLIDKIGYFVPMLLGYMVSIVGFYLLSTIHSNISVSTLIWYIAISGMGIGILMVTSVTVCTSTVPEEQVSLASGIFAMMRNLGGAIGVALFVSITLTNLNYFSSFLVDEGIAKFKASDIPVDIQNQAIERLESRRHNFFDSNIPSPSFEIDQDKKDEILEQKIKETMAQLPNGTPLTPEIKQKVQTTLEEEFKKIEQKVSDVRNEIKIEGKTFTAQSMGYSFLSGFILIILFSFSTLALRKRSCCEAHRQDSLGHGTRCRGL
jgi:EmrB/QacA subfamily drug resistance transporter